MDYNVLLFVKNDKDWNILGDLLHTMYKLQFHSNHNIMKVSNGDIIYYAWQTSQTWKY